MDSINDVQIIRDLRNGKQLDSTLVKTLTGLPHVDQLRRLIQEGDWAWIKDLCTSEDGVLQRFGLTLLRPIHHVPGVSELLRQLWEDSDLPVHAHVYIQFEILQDEQLSAAVKEELLKFTLDNWSEWLQSAACWIGGDAKAVCKYVQSRLDDPSIPASKRWIYACVLGLAGSASCAESLFKRLDIDPDAFVRMVAKKVREKCGVGSVVIQEEYPDDGS